MAQPARAVLCIQTTSALVQSLTLVVLMTTSRPSLCPNTISVFAQSTMITRAGQVRLPLVSQIWSVQITIATQAALDHWILVCLCFGFATSTANTFTVRANDPTSSCRADTTRLSQDVQSRLAQFKHTPAHMVDSKAIYVSIGSGIKFRMTFGTNETTMIRIGDLVKLALPGSPLSTTPIYVAQYKATASHMYGAPLHKAHEGVCKSSIKLCSFDLTDT